MMLAAVVLTACGTREDHGAWREQLFQGSTDAADAPSFQLDDVRVPDRLRGIAAAGPDGEEIRIACDTCHGLLDVELSRRGPERLQSQVGGPHVGLAFEHGPLDCAHCHDAAAPHQLRTADARTLPTTEAIELCSQCHGLQWRDFQHGAHGGMRGHWDRAAGPRERNHCVDCHDPHAPAFQRYRPLPPPVDRFAPIPPHRNGPVDHGAPTRHEAAPEPSEDGS